MPTTYSKGVQMNTSNLFTTIIKKLPKLFIGFALCALGITLMLTADIGLNPWGTFTSGLKSITHLSFGRLSQLIGFSIIILTIPLKVVPGVGTVLNMIFIGMFIDIFKSLSFMIQPSTFILQLFMCLVGLIVFSYGVYMYISCGLGAGPRDGLMLALIKITGKTATVIKPAIEITVTALGLLLGGPLGIGTVLVAFLGGKILDMIFTMKDYDPKATEHKNLVHLSMEIKALMN